MAAVSECRKVATAWRLLTRRVVANALLVVKKPCLKFHCKFGYLLGSGVHMHPLHPLATSMFLLSFRSLSEAVCNAAMINKAVSILCASRGRINHGANIFLCSIFQSRSFSSPARRCTKIRILQPSKINKCPILSRAAPTHTLPQ